MFPPGLEPLPIWVRWKIFGLFLKKKTRLKTFSLQANAIHTYLHSTITLLLFWFLGSFGTFNSSPIHPQSISDASPKHSQCVPSLRASPMHSQNIPKATLVYPKHPQSVARVSLMRSQSIPEASLGYPQCVPKASPMRP